MKIFIAGGTGFIGQALIARLTGAGHEVTVLVRNPAKKLTLPQGARGLAGDPLQAGAWQESVARHQAIINLTGAPIFERWTREYKKVLYDSRMVATRNIVAAIPVADPGQFTLINASAIGYYGSHAEDEITEASGPGQDFLAELCVAWENEAFKARDRGARVLVVRIAPVLGRGGGALAKMLPLFKKGLGGRIGNGRQWFSWIHIDDLCRAILHLLDHAEISGPVNLCAPTPVRNLELTAALGQALARPELLPVPVFALKLALGEMSSALIESSRVMPELLTRSGFSFEYPELDRALGQILTS